MNNTDSETREEKFLIAALAVFSISLVYCLGILTGWILWGVP